MGEALRLNPLLCPWKGHDILGAELESRWAGEQLVGAWTQSGRGIIRQMRKEGKGRGC